MKTDPWIPAGVICKAHGLRGEVLLALDSGENFPFPKQGYIKNSSFKSLDIVQARICHKGVLILFHGYENRDQAQSLQGKVLYIHKKHFRSRKGQFLYLCEVLGFAVFLKGEKTVFGKVDHFVSNSHQDLLAIQTKKDIVLAPFVHDYIQSIDFNRKELHLKLPEDFPGVS